MRAEPGFTWTNGSGEHWAQDHQSGVTDIGPLAVCPGRQRTGLGGRIMSQLEAHHDITSVGVVSCRTDILPFYRARGYRTFQQLPLEQVCSVVILGDLLQTK